MSKFLVTKVGSAGGPPNDPETKLTETFADSSQTDLNQTEQYGVVCLLPVNLVAFFSTLMILILVSGTLANVTIYHGGFEPDGSLVHVLKRFDLGHEPSIPNFYSAVAILICALFLGLIGYLEKQKQVKDYLNWYFLGVIFVGLALDESAMIHEMANTAIGYYISTSGVLFLPWVIAGAIFALLVAIKFIPFVARKSRRTIKLFVIAGAVFVAGALGMEMVASLVFDHAGSEEMGVTSYAHTISQSIEEFLEMLGIIIFMYALVDCLATYHPSIHFQFKKI